ncbi:hypothetical protein [Alkaliphilus metalliredigens]|uniref:hypothetical protein n=1 Tax=Alkaliphilus metalliredigens TaxID=208226 RepID=UPI0005A2E415|nr:hypothetical protein [Alkaliphilus metalliredigens]
MNFVANKISKEFELDFKIITQNNDNIFCFGDYKAAVSIEELISLQNISLQKKSCYALDKRLLEDLKTLNIQL